MNVDYLDKFKGTLISVAIGDTLGRPFEGVLRDSIHKKYSNYEKLLENKTLFGTYTDDTQLTLHTAKALVQGQGFDLTTLIEEYISWLDDPPIGAGYGCISSIKKLKYGMRWKEAASNSGGNGTAMRISPVGLLYSKNIERMKEVCLSSSQITHSHPAASAAAIVTARAISYLLDFKPERGFSTDDFFRSLRLTISDSNKPVWNEFIEILDKVKSSLDMPLHSGLIKLSQIGVKDPYFIENYLGKAFVHPYSLSTVACSLFVFLKNLDSYKECIFELSTAGGDSDTIGAIGGGMAGAYFGYDAIPEELKDIVQDKKKVLRLAKKLYNVYKQKHIR